MAGQPAATHAEPIGMRGPVVLVLSPHAGGAQAGDAASLLESAGVHVGARVLVSDLDHALPQGAAWQAQGFEAVVAAGGDGTIGAVASQLKDTHLPMGILPMGTANDVARSLGIPLDLDQACAVIARGDVMALDAGQVLPGVTEPGALATEGSSAANAAPPAEHATTAALATSGAYFLHAMTLGFNVEFARLATDVARRQRWGPLTYATSVLEALSHFQAVPVILRLAGVRRTDGSEQVTDELVVTCQAAQIAVVNTPVFGGSMGWRLPNVALRDQLLDFVVIEAPDARGLRSSVEALLHTLGALGDGILGHTSAHQQADDASTQPADPHELRSVALPGVRRFQAREALIETPGLPNPLDITLDGEIRARTPALVRVAPEPLHVFAPAAMHAAS